MPVSSMKLFVNGIAFITSKFIIQDAIVISGHKAYVIHKPALNIDKYFLTNISHFNLHFIVVNFGDTVIRQQKRY